MINLRRLFQQNPNLDEEAATRVFHFFDADNSGFIDTAELQAALRALGFRCTHLGARIIIDSIDDDGDGAISLKEWLDMLRDSRAEIEAAADKLNRFCKQDDEMINAAGIRALAKNESYLAGLRAKTQSVLDSNKHQFHIRVEKHRSDTHETLRRIAQQPFRKSSSLIDLTRRTHLAALAGDFDLSNQLEVERQQLELVDRARHQRASSERSSFIKQRHKRNAMLCKNAMLQRHDGAMESIRNSERVQRQTMRQKMTNVRRNVGRSHRRAQHLLNVGQTDLGKHATAGRRYADGLSKVRGRLELASLSMINDFSKRDYQGPSETVERFNPRDEMLAKLSTYPGPTGREPAAERPGAALRRRASMKPAFKMDVTAAIEHDLGEEARMEEQYANDDNMVRWGTDKTVKL